MCSVRQLFDRLTRVRHSTQTLYFEIFEGEYANRIMSHTSHWFGYVWIYDSVDVEQISYYIIYILSIPLRVFVTVMLNRLLYLRSVPCVDRRAKLRKYLALLSQRLWPIRIPTNPFNPSYMKSSIRIDQVWKVAHTE